MLELLYTALLYLIQPLIWIRLWVRGRKAPAYRKRWGERYGFYRHPLKPGGIMLHSVSVGETLAAIRWCARCVIVILIYRLPLQP